MKKFYKFILTAFLFILCTGNVIYAQGATYFSQGNLDPVLTSSWNMSREGYEQEPVSFDLGDIFVIQYGHHMITSSRAWDISGNGSSLWIEYGGILESTFNNGVNYEITLSSETEFYIENGGKYIHGSQNTDNGNFPPPIFNGIEYFSDQSTIEIIRWDYKSNGNKMAPFANGIDWGNLTIKYYPIDDWNFASVLTYIQGDFIFDVNGTTKFISLSVGGTPLTLTVGGDFIVKNGILKFTAGQVPSNIDYTLNLGGDFLLQGGTFEHPQSGTESHLKLYLQGVNKEYNISGGTLSENNIDWIFYYQSIYTLKSNIPVALGRKLEIMGLSTLDCTDKSVTGAGNFIINGLAILKTSHINGVDGSVVVTGTKTFADLSSSLFYGNLNQMTGTSIPDYPKRINELTIDKNNSSSLTLSHNVQVRTLYMKQGNIITGSNILILGEQYIGLLGDLIRESGTVIGKFRKYFGNTIETNLLTTFPVGTANSYRPVQIKYLSPPQFIGYLTVEHLSGPPGSNNTSNIIDTTVNPEYELDVYWSEGYWQVDASINSLKTTNYDIFLTVQNITGANLVSELRIIKRSNSGADWILQGNYMAGDYYDNDINYPRAKRSTLKGFSQFTMAGNFNHNPFQGGLPVKLASFNSIINGRNVKLNWMTEMEENNSGFEIQKSEYRSKETGDWTKIGFVKGKGNSKEVMSYSFEDRNVQTGKYKYRLKQIDYNGNFEYFELAGIVEVGVPAKFDLSQNYPNPFNPVTKINFDIPQSGLVSLKIYDVLGKEVATIMNEMKDAGYYTITFDASKLSSGVYFYRLTSKGFSSVKRLVVLK